MKIHRNIEILSLYMDGELDKKLKDVVESHLQDCSECREILARMQKTKGLMEETPPVNAPAYLEKEILDSLPSKKVPSLSPFKKFSVGAVTFTVLLLASLLLFNRYKTEDIQIAMSPEQIKELEKKIGHRRDMYEDGMDASKPSFGTMKEKGETVPSSEIQAEPDASEKDRRFEDRSLLKEGGLVDEKKGADKIKECEGKELIFVFNFVCNGLNEIYYIKYDKKVFELFDIEVVEYSDGTNKLHYLIPSPLLTLLHKDKPKCLLKVRCLSKHRKTKKHLDNLNNLNNLI